MAGALPSTPAVWSDTLQTSWICVELAEPGNQGSGVGAPLSTAYRHFAYGIGRNPTSSLSEMGRVMDMKGLFMQTDE